MISSFPAKCPYTAPRTEGGLPADVLHSGLVEPLPCEAGHRCVQDLGPARFPMGFGHLRQLKFSFEQNPTHTKRTFPLHHGAAPVSMGGGWTRSRCSTACSRWIGRAVDRWGLLIKTPKPGLGPGFRCGAGVRRRRRAARTVYCGYGVRATSVSSFCVEIMCLFRRMAFGSIPRARPSIWGRCSIGISMGCRLIDDA